MDVLEQIATAAAHVAERAGGAVVAIGRDGRGSGIVFAGGRVLTNAHNIRGAETTVTFVDGRRATGTVTGIDVDGDFAVVVVDTGDATPVEWPGDDGGVRTGTAVFALANPGGRGLRTTFGTVSAVGQSFRGPRGRRISGAFEHTAPLGRGSSGGPVLDAEGRLLGVNTNRAGDGFYLAVAADGALRDRLEALARGESPHRPRLGVGLAPAHVANRLRTAVGLPPRDGLLLQAVEEGAPADRAGLRPGDLLVEVDGHPILRADDLLDLLEDAAAGATLTLRVVRGAEERTVAVRFDADGGADGTV